MTGPDSGTDVIAARFDPAALQAWTPTRTFFVDPDACRRYAAATNEDDPERWAAGVAPPVFGVVATVPHVHEVLQANVPERARAENRSVHGEHDVHYHRPLVPGSTLLVRGRLYGVQPKSSGTLLVTLVEMADPDTGDVVHEQYFVNFLRGVTTDEPIGQAPSPHRLPDAASLGDPAETTSLRHRRRPDLPLRRGVRRPQHLSPRRRRGPGRRVRRDHRARPVHDGVRQPRRGRRGVRR